MPSAVFGRRKRLTTKEKKLLLSELEGGGTYFGHSIDYCLQLVLSPLLSTNQLTRIDSFFFYSFLIKIIFSFKLLNNTKNGGRTNERMEDFKLCVKLKLTKKIVPQYVTGISRGATTTEREQN